MIENLFLSLSLSLSHFVAIHFVCELIIKKKPLRINSSLLHFIGFSHHIFRFCLNHVLWRQQQCMD